MESVREGPRPSPKPRQGTPGPRPRPHQAPLCTTVTSRRCMKQECVWKATMTARTLNSSHPRLCHALGGRAGHHCPLWVQRAGRAFWNRAHVLGCSGVHFLGLLWFPFFSRGLFLAFPTHSQHRKRALGDHEKRGGAEGSSTSQLLLEVADLHAGRPGFPV